MANICRDTPPAFQYKILASFALVDEEEAATTENSSMAAGANETVSGNMTGTNSTS
jgi:hypothetical protein